MSKSDALRLFGLFVDGRGYAGQVENITPPKLTIKTEDDRSGGMDGTRKMDMGMEAMELSYAIEKADPDLMKMFGLVKGGDIAITLRGGIDRDGTTVRVVINARGRLIEIDEGEWSAKQVEQKHLWTVNYYKRTVSGEVIHEIDVDNAIRIIDGVDQLKELRDAAGI